MNKAREVLKIRLIDNTLDPREFYQNNVRGNGIKRFLESKDCIVYPTAYLNENTALLEPICDLYLIHITQDHAVYYMEKLSKKYPKIPIITYSGGGIKLTEGKVFSSSCYILNNNLKINISNPRYAAVWQPVLNSGTENDFLTILESLCSLLHYRKGDESSEMDFLTTFHKMLGFDWLLEYKLNILHHLHVPQAKERDFETIQIQWQNLIEYLKNVTMEESDLQTYGEVWKQFVKDSKKPWEFASNPFDEDYMNKLSVLSRYLIDQ